MTQQSPRTGGPDSDRLAGEVTHHSSPPCDTGEVVAHSLTENEAVIEAGLATFVEVGRALMEIRDGRQYRSAGWSDFDAYCRERFGHGRDYADRVITAGKVMAELPTIVSSSLNEAQARELSPLKDDPEAMAEVMEEVTTEAEAAGGKVTATKIRDAVDRVEARRLSDAISDALRNLHEGLPGLVKIAGQPDLPMAERECAAALAWSALEFFDRLPTDPEGACAALAGTTRRVSEVLR